MSLILFFSCTISSHNLPSVRAIILLSLLLSGCFDRYRTTDSLCNDNASLCQPINLNDGQCRIQRTNLIWQRYDTLQIPSDEHKFKELKATQECQHCLEYAARIEPTELKQRKTKRIEALYHSYESIERLTKELQSSQDPHIIYYRWSQGDQIAKQQFIALEGDKKLEHPELQLALARYYVNKDKHKSLDLLHHSLSLYKAKDNINISILRSLSTLYYQQHNMAAAYVWTNIAAHYQPNNTLQKITRHNLFKPPEDEQKKLDRVALNIIATLNNGQYRRTSIIHQQS
ncbi:DUF2989 domain-containing protein [uncultured Photobacterium sp.]|uniref:DUF2989 domain-containing protein n=1 Tax=uncultured Photobacterium sp. TaxID=173973 RepID=UPI0026045534|nr:DUF2989 domain-containing protein [uncultured Photobacterium sp.]